MKTLIVLASLVSLNAFAEWTCFPSKKNEFATQPLTVKVTSKKIIIREDGSNGYFRVGEAKLRPNSTPDARFIKFDANHYSGLDPVKSSSPPPDGQWYGEGYGDVYLDRALIKGAEKGSLAMAWCYHWCNYDYFVCRK